MTTSLSSHKTGLALGALLGLWHALWSLLVAAGAAQPLADWIFRLHMIQPVYRIGPFSLATAILLVVVTTVVGYAFGAVFALLWNKLHNVK